MKTLQLKWSIYMIFERQGLTIGDIILQSITQTY